MSLVVPAPFISYVPPSSKHHHHHHHAPELFHDIFSDDSGLAPAADTNGDALPASSSRNRLINLKRRFKKVLRIPNNNKRQNMVEPNTMRMKRMDSLPHKDATASVVTADDDKNAAVAVVLPGSPAAAATTVTGGNSAPKGILKKQTLISPMLSRSQRNVRYNERVVVLDTFGSFEYDRSMDGFTSSLCLTPEMVAFIKEDLNHFKFNEMQVHPASRVYTHFFV